MAAQAGQDESPRIALSRGVYIADDRATALAEMRDDLEIATVGMITKGQIPPGQSIERYCDYMHIAYGHPDEVAASFARDQVLPYATDLILQFDPVFPTLDKMIRMLERVVVEVMPALR